ncbi:protein starmaker-like [Vitis riparia]|uniref:protein starmaker-like n=1 Tax=Vitis riparia TaxID=96939 RepID=UPI00155B04DD|nr:protein starmaker-like [Vitis riparia]
MGVVEGKSRTHDSDEDSSDRDDRYDGKITKRKATEKDPESSTDDSDDSISDDSKEESSDSDSGSSSSDYRHERKDTNKSMRKRKSGDGVDANAKGERGAYGSDHRRKERSDLYNDDDGVLGTLKNLENKLYQSRGTVMHGSGFDAYNVVDFLERACEGSGSISKREGQNRSGFDYFSLSEPQLQAHAQSFAQLHSAGTSNLGASLPSVSTPGTGSAKRGSQKPPSRLHGSANATNPASPFKTMELTPAARRKKPKLLEKQIPDKIAALAPKSAIYTQLAA